MLLLYSLMQVIVESPEVLVPLMSAIANAWIATCDKRLGLFSGARLAAAAGAPAGGGGHSERRGDVVDMLAADHGAEDDPSHEDATLQVRKGSLRVCWVWWDPSCSKPLSCHVWCCAASRCAVNEPPANAVPGLMLFRGPALR